MGAFVGRERLITAVLVVMLAAGLCLLAYPTVSDWWNSSRQSQAVASYTEAVEGMDAQEQEAMLAEARAYNAELSEHVFNGGLDEQTLARYEKLLDVTGTGIMGYVEVPSIGCKLPVYHGTNEGVLQIAVGHLEWTSLPVGGEGTHCAVSGHRGLPSAKLFTNIDKLAEGDFFELHVLGQVLAYEVDQVRIVEPSDVAELSVRPGEDLCTLVTCTPYGINTHRLLVRGHRADESSYLAVPADAVLVDPTTVAAVAGLPLAAVALAVFAAGGLRKRSRRAARAEARKALGDA